jgi:hypothetical protein
LAKGRLRPALKLLTAALVILPAAFMVLALVLQSRTIGVLWLLASIVCLVWGLCILRRERWLGIACTILAVAQFGLAIVIGLFFRNAHLLPHMPSTVVASCQGDFQTEQPKPGWRYLWNANGELGDPNAYAPLQWDGQRYTADTSYPSRAPVHFLRITEHGGHPGHGSGQAVREGNEIARYAIYAFTVPASGQYAIIESRLSRPSHTLGGQVDLRVFVNAREIGPTVICRSRDGLNFDRPLGKLSRGDTIYVAIGPGETDSDDAFGLDFTIAR